MNKEQVLALVSKPAHAALISDAVEHQNAHKIHVTGEGYEDKVRQIIGYENDQDFAKKKELANPITTYIYDLIISEQNRWINSEVAMSFKWRAANHTDEFSEYLQTVWKNQSIDYFVRTFLKDALYSEFNGFAFVERTPAKTDDEGKPVEDGKPYLIFIAIDNVWDFDSDGNTVNYLCYKMAENKMRFIDNENDYVLVRRAGTWEIQDTIKNVLGYVPACQLSTKTKSLLINEVKTSYVNQSLPVADDYLTFFCEYVITCVLHGHPIQYATGVKCDYEEKATGRKCEDGVIGMDDGGQILTCPVCKGKGKRMPRDTAEIMLLPQFDVDGKPYDLKSPAGFVNSPVETIQDQRTNLDWMEKKLYLSCLGQNDFLQTSYDTATESIINSKSLENINNNILANVEYVCTFIIDIIGKYLYQDNYQGARVRYSRQFNLKNENLLLDEIKKAKESGGATSYLYRLGEELISTRYVNNPELLRRMMALFRLEPCPFLTIAETPEEDKDMKVNLQEYVQTLEEKRGMQIEDILDKDGYTKTREQLEAIGNNSTSTTPQREQLEAIGNNSSSTTPQDETPD